MTGPRIVYVVGTYPVPTTTFIDREIQQLRELGVRVEPVSIRCPARELSEAQRALQTTVTYVLPAPAVRVIGHHARFLLRHPVTYLRTLVSLVSRPHPTVDARVRTVAHFGLGVHVAGLIRRMGPVDHLHAHFVDRAAVVALVAARLLGLPYSATAHASDIYVDPVLLPEKLADAKFVATCTRYNAEHLRSIPVAGEPPVRCIYHGLDLSGFHPAPRTVRERPLLLTVAQLKERKGISYLIDATRILTDRGIDVDIEIVGGGPLQDQLEAQTRALGLTDRVRFLGAIPHDRVLGRYAEASMFVLPCVIGSDGDRDGIPNVILEAMAMGLPVVSTRHSGIPEAVDDGRTGLLVPAADAEALADAIAELLEDPQRRTRMGEAGRQVTAERFDVEANVRRLLAEFVA